MDTKNESKVLKLSNQGLNSEEKDVLDDCFNKVIAIAEKNREDSRFEAILRYSDEDPRRYDVGYRGHV